MGRVDDGAPSAPGLAALLTAQFAGFDDAVNGLHDRLNAALPRLWWPLHPPAAEQRLGPPEHALYAAHVALAGAALLLLAPRRTRAAAVVATACAGAVSWAVFTGAWDRRADQAASADRRAR